jgi:hypothetical protein
MPILIGLFRVSVKPIAMQVRHSGIGLWKVCVVADFTAILK